MLLSLKENICNFMINPLLRFIFILLIFNACHTDTSIYYSQPILEEYHIICNPDSLTFIYTNFKDNTYIPIQIVSNRDTLKARMRIRGDSSRKDAKKSLKVKFILNGKVKTLNLNAEFSDKSYIRQYLSSQIMRSSGQNCYNTKFVKLSLNGKYFGLYLQVENMDKAFLKNNLMPENGNLYKATRDGACMSVFDDVNEDWEKKTGLTESRDDLKKLISDVNSVPDSLYLDFVNSTFNYKQLITIIALNIYLANASTYYHNYYLYHNSGKWELFPWDMDKTLSYYDWMPYQYHRTSSEWESDNPLIERGFLNRQIFVDIKNRIDELSKTSISPNAILPIITSLEGLLEGSVEKDSTDQINGISQWQDFLDKERKFFKSRHKKLQEQFATWPSTFSVKKIKKKVCEEIFFEWGSSKSPRGESISYILSISSDFLFHDTTALITKTTSDTTFLFTEKLPAGKYYWKVTATDGEFFVDGFNSKNVLVKVNCSYLPANISKNKTLTISNSPYIINHAITIEKGATLNIENGVEIRLDTGVNILVHGNLFVNGTKNMPVIFCPKQKAKEWGYFYFFNTLGVFDFTNIIEGKINAKYSNLSIRNSSINIKKKRLVFGINRNPIIWTHHGSFLLENSIIDGKGTGEGINTNFSKSIVRNSTFINLPDAIEFICVDEGLIENCMIKTSPDDAIDMNACHNIVVRNNRIINNSDKGISIGKEQYGQSSNILIEKNIIIGNKIGVAIKDSSFAVLKNNLFYNNHTAISIYRKDPESVGGFAEISENTFYKNSSSFSVDDFSKPTFLTNFSDGVLPFGKTKVRDNLADSILNIIEY